MFLLFENQCLFISLLPKAVDKEINLGDMAVYTSNFGISIVYQCEYSTAITVSAEGFDVQANGCKFLIRIQMITLEDFQ